MKKTIALLIAVIFLMSLLAGCGSSNTPQATTAAATTVATTAAATTAAPTEAKLSGKITFVTNMNAKIDTTLKDLAKQFTDMNPDVQIDTTSISGADSEKQINIWMASASLPDISYMANGIKSSDFPKYYVPIDDLGFTKDNLWFYSTGVGTDGKLYGLNDTVVYWGMYYSKKAFVDAGITAVPTTLDEFYADCEKLKAKGIIPYASNFKDKWPFGVFDFYGPAYTGNSNYDNEKVNSDEWLSDDGLLFGMKFTRTMKEKGYMEPDLMSTNFDNTFRNGLAQGKFAMAYLGDWLTSQLIDKGAKIDDLGMFPFPGAKGATLTGNLKWAVAMNSASQDAAKAYLKFLWDDGKYQKAVGESCPLKNVDISDPITKEIASMGTPVEMTPQSDDYKAILAKAQLDYVSILQEYVMAKDSDAVVKKYNQAWADARKALGK